MICFRDMCFCPYYEDCVNADGCGRALTPEVLAAADRWWGKPGAPIDRFAEKPSCWSEKE